MPGASARLAAPFIGSASRSCLDFVACSSLASNDELDTRRIPPGGTPGYDVYHVRVGWNPCRYATPSAAVENLTDEDYRIHGSGANEPGRDLVLMADFRF